MEIEDCTQIHVSFVGLSKKEAKILADLDRSTLNNSVHTETENL